MSGPEVSKRKEQDNLSKGNIYKKSESGVVDLVHYFSSSDLSSTIQQWNSTCLEVLCWKEKRKNR